MKFDIDSIITMNFKNQFNPLKEKINEKTPIFIVVPGTIAGIWKQQMNR